MKVRTKRHICAAVAAAGFVLALGVIGGIEHMGAPLGRGLITSLALLAVSAGAMWKGGWLR
jgi:hypothetical protein